MPLASGSRHSETRNLNPQPQTCFSLHFPNNHMQYMSAYMFNRGRSVCKCICPCACKPVFKRDGGLCFYSPGRTYIHTYILSRNFIEISGLIRPSQAKLGLYTDVLYFMSVPWSLFGQLLYIWTEGPHATWSTNGTRLAVSFHFVARSPPLCSNSKGFCETSINSITHPWILKKKLFNWGFDVLSLWLQMLLAKHH